MKQHALVTLLALVLLAGAAPGAPRAQAQLSSPVIVTTPKWQYRGCFSSWCQTGWYASPAVADLNGDGKPEVIWSPYSIYAIDGATGTEVWTVRSGHDRTGGSSDVGRTWPGIVVADIDGDGLMEVVTAHEAGWVGVYDGSGAFKPGWPRRPYTDEIRSLAVDDLDGDGRLEIIVALADGGNYNQWTVLQANGTTRPGWPRLAQGQPGYGWGAFNQNIGVADLDGDGRGEIIGPSDVHYISAFEDDGTQIKAHERYSHTSAGPKVWSQVGVHVDDAVDLRGYADCGNEHRPNFANSPPALVDMNGDGAIEVVVVGNVYDCYLGNDADGNLAYMPFIFKPDRSRWAAGPYDWTAIPPLGGASGKALSEDFRVIQSGLPNPVPADLDGDGVKELLYPSNDGKLHAFWMDKTQHGSWPFHVPQLFGNDMAFASEPVVVDLDNDGKAEVIFGSWPRNGGRRVGKLVVTDWQGALIQQLALPPPLSTDSDAWNGVLGAPTLANIDADPDLELVVGTVSSGIVAYDLPGSENARVLWGTGRGSFQRTGAIPSRPLRAALATDAALPQPGDTLTFRITLANPANAPLASLQISDALPAGLSYVQGSLSATRGTTDESGAALAWSGSVPAGETVTISFQAQIDLSINNPTVIANEAQVSGGQTMTLRVVLVVGGQTVLVPLLRR